MFRNKKILEQIELEKNKLLSIKEEIEKEKQQLLFIKEQLDNTTPKVDISDIYVWEDGGLYSIVRLEVYKFRGKDYYGNDADGYKSTLIDIFTNNVVYQKSSADLIKRREPIFSKGYNYLYYAKFFPLHGADKNLLAYTNKKVPLYVIQQLYYKLNNIDVNANVLKKQK